MRDTTPTYILRGIGTTSALMDSVYRFDPLKSDAPLYRMLDVAMSLLLDGARSVTVTVLG